MPIDWQLVITNIGTTLFSATVVVGGAGWVLKTLVSDRLARKAEEFKIQVKATADAMAEQLKNSFQMLALEHQVRFSKLHEKRACVIELVYQKLIDTEKAFGRFVMVEGHQTGTEQQKEAAQKIQDDMYEMSLFIEKNRIYLPAETCVALKEFLEIMWHSTTSVSVYGVIEQANAQTVQERIEVFKRAHKALTKEIPAARAALENEFRKMLGG